MTDIHYKNSLEFLKNRFKTGSPEVRKWVLEELRLRWTEVDKEWQGILDIFKSDPSPTSHE